MGTTVFHVTSSHNRDSIRRYGLDWRRMGDRPGIAGSIEPEGDCVFLARDGDEVDFLIRIGRNHHDALDVWEVTLPHDFDPHEDLPEGGPYAEEDGFLFTRERLHADHVRLLTEHP